MTRILALQRLKVEKDARVDPFCVSLNFSHNVDTLDPL